MANQLEPADIKWKYIKHLTLNDMSHYLYRDERFGIQMEQQVNRDGHGWSGKPKHYYFIDNIEKEYTDLEELCKDWNEIKNFDDPNSEIQWVKVIKTKNQ